MMCLWWIIIIIGTILDCLTKTEAAGDEHSEYDIETNKTIEVNDSNIYSSRFVTNVLFSVNAK